MTSVRARKHTEKSNRETVSKTTISPSGPVTKSLENGADNAQHAHDDADRRDAQDAADRFDGDGRATSTVDAPLATDDAAGADAGRRAGPQGTTRRQDDEPREKVRSDPSLMEQVSFRRPVFVFARSATVSMV